MDGNGRWAEARGKLRTRGHQEGAKRVDDITTAAADLGVQHLTLYAFSTENWSRPKTEVNLLWRLLIQHLKTMDKKLIKNGVSLAAVGTLDRLPDKVRAELNRVIKSTHLDHPKMTLTLCLSYGGRQEIADAAKKIAIDVREGRLDAESITEETLSRAMYRPGVPDPELLIRTGGESRVSNFLLWQIAYSEIYITPIFWPEFVEARLHEAIADFGQRERRFGKTTHQVVGKQSDSTKTELPA